MALAVLNTIADGLFNDRGSDEGVIVAAAVLLRSANLLGLLREDPEAWFKWQPAGAGGGLSDGDIDASIEARLDSRKAKNFAEADRIRKELADAGVILEDGPNGTTWRRG